MNDPLVSVVITAYNLGWCIDETLQSVFDQSYRNFEVIVVDDASTDDTQERMKRYAHRVKYIRHATNQGLLNNAEAGPARNTGIRAASGDFIAILDGDDLWEPDKIAEQVAAAKRFPNAGIIVADGVSFAHEDGRILRSTLLLDAGSRFLSSLPDGAVVTADLYRGFLRDCLVDTPSQVMIASRVFASVGLFSPCRCDDYEFYLRASAQFQFAIVKKRLVKYRQHSRNLSGEATEQFFRFVQPNIDIWRQHLRVCRDEVRPIVSEQIERTLARAAERATREGHRKGRVRAWRYLWTMIRNNSGAAALPYVVYHLVLLGFPQRVANALGPLTRRARRVLNVAIAAAIYSAPGTPIFEALEFAQPFGFTVV